MASNSDCFQSARAPTAPTCDPMQKKTLPAQTYTKQPLGKSVAVRPKFSPSERYRGPGFTRKMAQNPGIVLSLFIRNGRCNDLLMLLGVTFMTFSFLESAAFSYPCILSNDFFSTCLNWFLLYRITFAVQIC